MVLPIVYVSADQTFTGAVSTPTPPAALSDGMKGFLHALDATLARPDATVLLDGDVLADLGIPEQLPEHHRDAAPALASARAAGWSVSKLDVWITFHRWETVAGRRMSRALHIGVLPWMDVGSCQLWNADPLRMTASMARYAAMVGVPYHGAHGGLAGITLMRTVDRRVVPRWRPDWSGVTPAQEATERAMLWTAPDDDMRHELPHLHGYDVRRQYLTSALVTNYSPDALVHTGAAPEPARYNRPGYYQVEVPPWAMADRCPHPMGPHRTVGETVWITHPTLDLLYQLDNRDGVISCPAVIDSWTAPADPHRSKQQDASESRVLRTWAEHLGAALDRCEGRRGESPQLISAIKGTYRAAIGMMRRDTCRVHRPDWADAIIGQARANLWRRIWAEGTTNGRWPASIDADTVWYAAQDADPHTAWPGTFPRGTFRVVASRSAVSTG